MLSGTVVLEFEEARAAQQFRFMISSKVSGLMWSIMYDDSTTQGMWVVDENY